MLKYYTVLPATHTFVHEWNEPSCLYSQPLSITARWPALISCPTEGRRLSKPGWLVTYRGGMLPEDGHLYQYQLTDSAAAGDRNHNH